MSLLHQILFLFNTVLLLYHVNVQVNIPSICLLLAEPETLVMIGHSLSDVTGESYLCPPVCAVRCCVMAAAGCCNATLIHRSLYRTKPTLGQLEDIDCDMNFK